LNFRAQKIYELGLQDMIINDEILTTERTTNELGSTTRKEEI